MARILSLHTECEILNLLQTILRRAGHEHLSAGDPETALNLLREKDVDLFVQNLMRPGINGCEFYDMMQNDNHLRHIPVLIVSAINPLTYPVICSRVIRDLYPDHYLVLPFSAQALVSIVNEILSASSAPTA